ncbi:MAG TPA: RluA family pseudouridine synthase [Polyangiaceae bacterium]|jgi:23S rRNA pseudouridine1911/1915/1917 synthase
MPLHLVVPSNPDSGVERIDRALARLLPGTSRATLQRWIGQGRVLLNGKPCRARDPAVPGSLVEVDPGPAPPSRAEADPSVILDVFFEDAHLVVVNKPAGLVVHPARGHAKGTLVNGLLARPGFERTPSDPRDPEGAMRPGIVHRLDKDTSGLIVVAKDERTREGLKRQLSERSVERLYRAITLGVPASGTLRSLYSRNPRSRLRFTSRTAEGRSAVTELEVLETLGGGRAALVECRLLTGRTHQIRVHLLEQAGTPVLADSLYGKPARDPELTAIADELGRQALHASVLGFIHPSTGRPVRFESPLPQDMETALVRLRKL